MPSERELSPLPPLTRRHFLALAGFAAANTLIRSSSAEEAGTITGTLRIDPQTEVGVMPPDYSGLSYESAQLANPAFFSAENRQLVALFRALTLQGVLRVGGGTSEYTSFSEEAPPGPAPFEVFGPDTSKTVKNGTITSALALKNLRAFLDATGWKCLYGLNLGQGSKENAAAEAEAVCRILGPRLLALQIGNEPDSLGRFRPKGWGPGDYIREWLEFHDAIVARTPQAKFAGPDISNKLSFLTAFAQMALGHRDIILLTTHYYAMGPAGNPLATMNNLLSPDPKLTTMTWQKVSIVRDAMHATQLPCRISEVNSCWNGGLAGVSDTFASALWCADMTLHFGLLGMAGVNLHGGGNGLYSPIVGSPSTGFKRRPEYFGIQFAQHFAGSALLHTDFQCSNDRVTAYAARLPESSREECLVALINKTDSPAVIHLPGNLKSDKQGKASVLTAPALDATTGVTLRSSRMRISPGGALRVGAHSALLFTAEAQAI